MKNKEDAYDVIKKLMGAFDVGQVAGPGSAIHIGRKFLAENMPNCDTKINLDTKGKNN